ncbi:MAG: cytidine deaminase [Synergistetes bacterium]|nr:MAG: Cytidine deaminase [bacterium 42_11]MBC7331592.1 cytidine deaminase [Synergistota bacterium]MDK2872081.1 cytidine deaminase [bacterium]
MVTETKKRELIELAIRAKERAYAPYSKFKVGSAILGKNGRVFLGCNVENSSYGLTVCAERVALYNAVSNGCKNFEAIAVVGDGDCYAFPCGACRQVLYEFEEDMLVLVGKPDGTFLEQRLKDLIPFGFRL